MLDQINQNPYFGCFEILSLFFKILFLFPIIVLGVLFSFLLLFWNIILFPIIPRDTFLGAPWFVIVIMQSIHENFLFMENNSLFDLFCPIIAQYSFFFFFCKLNSCSFEIKLLKSQRYKRKKKKKKGITIINWNKF